MAQISSLPLTPGEIRDRAAALRAGLQVVTQPPLDPAAPVTAAGHTTGAKGLMGRLFQLIPASMEIVRAITAPGADKAAIVSAAIIPMVSPLLRAIDIPWIPGAVETRIWDFIEQRILPHVITAVCTMLHARGIG